MNILFLGDIVGKAARKVLKEHLPRLKEKTRADITIANGENAAEGFGLTPAHVEELCAAGVDQITSGDHIWDRREIVPALETETRVIRPANYPAGAAGHGSVLVKTASGASVGVVNIQGRVFMMKQHLEDPFRVAKAEVEKLRIQTPIVLVDFHAEATSEKTALGRHLDGIASAVLGTHTHVQTADERILPNGTAYITDVGMTGPSDSVIGLNAERVLQRFLTQMGPQWKVAEGAVQICAVVVEVDDKTGRAGSIARIFETHEPVTS